MNTPLIKPSLIYLINLTDEMKTALIVITAIAVVVAIAMCAYISIGCYYKERPKLTEKKVVENFGYIRNMLYACVYSDTEQRNLLRNACRCTTDTTEHPKRR